MFDLSQSIKTVVNPKKAVCFALVYLTKNGSVIECGLPLRLQLAGSRILMMLQFGLRKTICSRIDFVFFEHDLKTSLTT